MINESFCDGIIVKGIGGFYYVKSGDKVIECHARGKFRKNELTPIVGDYVSLSMNEDGTGSICKILRTKFRILLLLVGCDNSS